jgi:hypothetical protein
MIWFYSSPHTSLWYLRQSFTRLNEPEIFTTIRTTKSVPTNTKNNSILACLTSSYFWSSLTPHLDTFHFTRINISISNAFSLRIHIFYFAWHRAFDFLYTPHYLLQYIWNSCAFHDADFDWLILKVIIPLLHLEVRIDTYSIEYLMGIHISAASLVSFIIIHAIWTTNITRNAEQFLTFLYATFVIITDCHYSHMLTTFRQFISLHTDNKFRLRVDDRRWSHSH